MRALWEVDDPDSNHYDDLLPIWLRNETFPFRFKSSDVVDHTEDLTVIRGDLADHSRPGIFRSVRPASLRG